MSRNKRIDIRLSDKERRAVEVIAARSGLKLSETTRVLLQEAITARGIHIIGLADMLFSDPIEPQVQSEVEL